MLNNIIEEEDDCFVFFYEDIDPDAHAILSELEGIPQTYSRYYSSSDRYVIHICIHAETA